MKSHNCKENDGLTLGCSTVFQFKSYFYLVFVDDFFRCARISFRVARLPGQRIARAGPCEGFTSGRWKMFHFFFEKLSLRQRMTKR